MRTLLPVLMLMAIAMALPAVEVAVSQANPHVAEMGREAVQDIFLGRKATWADGSRIEIVVARGGAAHERFLRDYVGRTPSQFSFHWRNLLFTGRGHMPTVVDGEAEMVAYLRQHENAIGYVVGADDSDGVRRIPIR